MRKRFEDPIERLDPVATDPRLPAVAEKLEVWAAEVS
jgi:hypothetical protein